MILIVLLAMTITFILTFGNIIHEVINGSFTSHTFKMFITLTFVIIHTSALILISTIIQTIEIILTIDSSVTSITFTFLQTSALSMIITIVFTFHSDMTVILKEPLITLTSVSTDSIPETIIWTSHIGIHDINEIIILVLIVIISSKYQNVWIIEQCNMSFFAFPLILRCDQFMSPVESVDIQNVQIIITSINSSLFVILRTTTQYVNIISITIHTHSKPSTRWFTICLRHIPHHRVQIQNVQLIILH